MWKNGGRRRRVSKCIRAMGKFDSKNKFIIQLKDAPRVYRIFDMNDEQVFSNCLQSHMCVDISLTTFDYTYKENAFKIGLPEQYFSCRNKINRTKNCLQLTFEFWLNFQKKLLALICFSFMSLIRIILFFELFNIKK